MLTSANIDVAETLQKFKERGIPVGFVVPTETGLTKSIMDAHDSLRRFFVTQGVHDYARQKQGTDNKKVLPTRLFSSNEVLETSTSLYRPETKSGDPRLWIYRLGGLASPGDLIAMTISEGRLVAINCTKSDLGSLLSPSNQSMLRLFPISSQQTSDEASELLTMLSDVSRKGFIKTMRPGDTGVGFTLETLLGIEANSNKAPDYKGIELKSSRVSKASNKQTTVFSQVPNWKLSNLKGSKDILDKHGRFNAVKGRDQLYHEISCTKLNSYDLQLELKGDWEELRQIYVPDGDKSRKETDVIWQMDKLIERVEEKHQETMWISAETRGKRAGEEFWYTAARHTTGLDPTALPILLEAGSMTVHYLIKRTPTGAAKDQGYLFKMAPKHLPVLFANSVSHDLSKEQH